ncbi:MAG: WD40 repeat domain-containing protein, partial [Acidimicrobiales bacterium]
GAGEVRSWTLGRPDAASLPEGGFAPDALGWVGALAVSPDGRRLAIGGELASAESLPPGAHRGVVRIVDLAAGAPAPDSNGQPAELRTAQRVRALAWSPSGQRLAAGGGGANVRDGGDASIVLWDLARDRRRGDEVRRLAGHPSPVEGLAFRSEDRLLSAGSEHTVQLWDAAGSWRELRGHEQSFCGPGSTPEREWDQRFCAVWGVAWRPDGARVATAGFDRTVRVWDRAGSELLRIEDRHVTPWATPNWDNDWLRRLAWSPDGALLAAGSDDFAVRVWDAATGAVRHVLRAEGYTNSLAFSPDGGRLAAGGQANAVELWDVATGQRTRLGAHGPVKAGAESAVSAVAWRPDGAVVASVGYDEALRLWDANGGQADEVQLPARATGLSFSPDGRRIAAALTNGAVALYDPAALAAAPVTLTNRPLPLMGLGWSPDGRRLAVAAIDGVVTIWNVAERRAETAPFRKNLAFDLAFAPDGASVAVATFEGIVYLVPVLEGLFPAACALAGRNLSRAEWAAHLGAERPYRVICPEHAPGEGDERAGSAAARVEAGLRAALSLP